MMTWEQFKLRVENAGVLDSDLIEYLDLNEDELGNGRVRVRRELDGATTKVRID